MTSNPKHWLATLERDGWVHVEASGARTHTSEEFVETLGARVLLTCPWADAHQ